MPIFDVEEDLGRDGGKLDTLAGEVRGVVGGGDGDEAFEEVPASVAPRRADQVREIDLEGLAFADQALHFASLGGVRGSAQAAGRRARRRYLVWRRWVVSAGGLDKQVACRAGGAKDLPCAVRMVEHGVGAVVVREKGRVGWLVARRDAEQVKSGVVRDRPEPDALAVSGVHEPRWNRR